MTQHEDDPEDPERDRQGRWRKGVTGNPNGRPRKKPRRDTSNSYIFANTQLKIDVNGEPKLLLRKEIVREKLFQQGMKGDVRALIQLDKISREADEAFAVADLRYRELMAWLIETKPATRPNKIQWEIAGLEDFLGIREQRQREVEARLRREMREARREKMQEFRRKKK